MPHRVATLARTDLETAQALLGRACAHDSAGTVASEKLFGGAPGNPPTATLGAWQGETLAGVAVVSGRWLRLLAVDPPARRRGVGSALLAQVRAAARTSGQTRLRTCDQPGNYLAPGVDARDQETIAWLERRGFTRRGEAENLGVPLTGNALVGPGPTATATARARSAGYELARAMPADAAEIRTFVEKHFGSAWAFEAAAALAGGGLHVARKAGALVAFAAHDGNNRGLGWFGPAGTLPDHRGGGLGHALLLGCLDDIAAMGLYRATIAWIGPRAFYERTVGAVSDRTFVVLQEELEEPLA